MSEKKVQELITVTVVYIHAYNDQKSYTCDSAYDRVAKFEFFIKKYKEMQSHIEL